jgi:hypothetical protein
MESTPTGTRQWSGRGAGDGLKGLAFRLRTGKGRHAEEREKAFGTERVDLGRLEVRQLGALGVALRRRFRPRARDAF